MSKHKNSKNGINPILIKLMDKPYETKYSEECRFLWKNYVPKTGQSNVLQGELLRQLEKLRYEAQDNGNINWYDDFDYLCDFIKETLCKQDIYTDNEKEKYKLILDYFKECGNYSIGVQEETIPDEEIDMERVAYVYDNLYDIIADAIGFFYSCYPEPIYIELNENLYI